MKTKLALLLFLLILAAPLALCQTSTPIAELPNTVTICTEVQNCTLQGESVPAAAVFQFGAGTTWCQTITNPATPLAISWADPNPALCPYDPAPNVNKTLVAIQGATAYTVTAILNGEVTVVSVPALPPPAAAAYTPTFKPGTVYTLTLTNVAAVSGPPSTLLSTLNLPAYLFVAGVLQNFTMTTTIGGVPMTCAAAAVPTPGTVSLNCIPAPIPTQ